MCDIMQASKRGPAHRAARSGWTADRPSGVREMKKLIALGILVGVVAIAALVGNTHAALATATCNDGTQSSSYGSGTCSYHGGVDYNYPYYP